MERHLKVRNMVRRSVDVRVGGVQYRTADCDLSVTVLAVTSLCPLSGVLPHANPVTEQSRPQVTVEPK